MSSRCAAGLARVRELGTHLPSRSRHRLKPLEVLTSPLWCCNWRGYGDGDDSPDWRGAAADIFPGRRLGYYKLDASAKDGVIDMNWTKSDGEVRISAMGK